MWQNLQVHVLQLSQQAQYVIKEVISCFCLVHLHLPPMLVLKISYAVSAQQ